MMTLNAKVVSLLGEGLERVYWARCKVLEEAQERLTNSALTARQERGGQRDVVEAMNDVEFVSQIAQCFFDLGREVVGGKIEGYICEGLFSGCFDGKDSRGCRVRLEIRCVDEPNPNNSETLVG